MSGNATFHPLYAEYYKFQKYMYLGNINMNYTIITLFPLFQYTECVHSCTFWMYKVGNLQYVTYVTPARHQEDHVFP